MDKKIVPTAQNITTELWALFSNLRDKKLEPKIAKEMNNAAGKIISVHRDALKHEVEGRRKPNMPFYRSLA